VVYEVDGAVWRPLQSEKTLGPTALALEEEMFSHRLRAAEAFVLAQGLDRMVGAEGPAHLGIVAAGTTFFETLDALSRLGVAVDDLAGLGIRIYKPALMWPLEPSGLNRFAAGLEELMVIEEKRPFIENQVRALLYNVTDAPRVFGKESRDGRPLTPIKGALVSDDIIAPLRHGLGPVVPEGRLRVERARIAVTVTSNAAPIVIGDAVPDREAHYCSGCPHNRSTVVPEGSVAGGGIGCHGMSINMDRGTIGITQMGGEGAQWVGMEPFLTDTHRFQNIGDGTFAHSGSLAVRQAISAGSNVTYKILYNHTVAMTGGQDAAGEIPVPALTRMLEAEGVVQIGVVAADPDEYPSDARWANNATVVHRDKLVEMQRELRDVRGVTVLIYDQGCAAELRRGRKRGTVVTPTTRVMINEAICEGCGDCGRVSNCASVHPVMTPFGRKTQIHQESCNFDLTCLEGNCPAFVTVEIDPDYKPTKVGLSRVPEGELPPEPMVPAEASLVFVGMGGTGVVTMSQVVSTAALLAGRVANSLDQTGLSQKGGTVVSNVRISADESAASNFVGDGQADALLVFDLVSGVSPKILARASAEKTTAIVSSGLVPTGAMVSGRGAETFPELTAFRAMIDPVSQPDKNLWLDAAGIAQRLFASQPLANALVLGVAYQRGLIPVESEYIEKAIELNGVAVESNVASFRLGRRLAADPQLLETLEAGDTNSASAPTLSGTAATIASSVSADAELAEVLAWRVPELIAYQDAALAREYAADVGRLRQAEIGAGLAGSELSRTAARHLFHLMAYKDEYEVARLALKSDMAAKAKARFGAAAKISYRLQPPALKTVGYDKKIALPQAAGDRIFHGLVRAKRVRGKRLDPFGQTEERKMERQLIHDYRELMDTVGHQLSADNYDEAVALLELADQIRGYDTVKLANVTRYRSEVRSALATFLR